MYLTDDSRVSIWNNIFFLHTIFSLQLIYLYELKSYALLASLDISCIFNYVTLFNLFFSPLFFFSCTHRSITNDDPNECAKWNYYSLSACYPSTQSLIYISWVCNVKSSIGLAPIIFAYNAFFVTFYKHKFCT
jgi:hypothetical protein